MELLNIKTKDLKLHVILPHNAINTANIWYVPVFSIEFIEFLRIIKFHVYISWSTDFTYLKTFVIWQDVDQLNDKFWNKHRAITANVPAKKSTIFKHCLTPEQSNIPIVETWSNFKKKYSKLSYDFLTYMRISDDRKIQV